MVSDDKHDVYKKLKNSTKHQNYPSINHTRPSSKFTSVPTGEKINLYSAICADCHHEVKVNFEPVPNEPFYCDYCLNNHRI